MGAGNNGTSFMEKQTLQKAPPPGSILCIDNQFVCVRCKLPFTRVWQQVLPSPPIFLAGQARIPTKLMLCFCFKCNWSCTPEEAKAWEEAHKPADAADTPIEKPER